jgi:Tryptophan-rich Synechocystis species C-terminal domain
VTPFTASTATPARCSTSPPAARRRGVADFAIDVAGNVGISLSDLIGANAIPVVVESFGSTSLVQGGNYALYPVGGGTGPFLKYGSAITVGQYGAWTFIGAEQITGGYEVALHLTRSDQYTVWNTDANGNVVANGTGDIVAGTSNALRSLEPSFQQDLNGDGTIGVPPGQVALGESGVATALASLPVRRLSVRRTACACNSRRRAVPFRRHRPADESVAGPVACGLSHRLGRSRRQRDSDNGMDTTLATGSSQRNRSSVTDVSFLPLSKVNIAFPIYLVV